METAKGKTATIPLSISPTLSPTLAGNENFENPDFPCPTDQIHEPDQGYPFPIRQDTGERKSVSELTDFCLTMKERFSESGITGSEAEKIYSLLKLLPFLHNECYGMPICTVEPFRIDKQVMVRKIKDSDFELFYYFIGCGMNYHFINISIDQDTIGNYKFIERWSESFPC